MKFLPTIMIVSICLAIMCSVSATSSDPTHFNILYQDSLGNHRVFSEAFEDIEVIAFTGTKDGEAFDSIKVKLRDHEVTFESKDVENETLPGERSGDDDPLPEEPIEKEEDSIAEKPSRVKIIEMDGVESYSFGTNVPKLQIFTDSVVEEVFSKTEYLRGYAKLTGYNAFDDLDSVSVNVRGRGNSTWKEVKKPYRLKFDKKLSLCGMKSAKSFVLIANYIDKTFLKNAMALKLAELLEMPFTNHSIPVNVEFNGIPKGAYMLSEKQGIGKGSVDIDEETGILWELDNNFDEEYQFKSPIYDLPVMVADPDPADFLPDSIARQEWFGAWKEDFERMEESVANGRPEETIDMASVIDYLLVNLVVGNCEVDWPKSVKLFKPDKDSLYVFGPVWDFDWALGYAFSYSRRLCVTYPTTLKGSFFFRDIIRSREFMPLFVDRWKYFLNNIYPQWMDYLYEYADMIKVSALQDYEIWEGENRYSTDFDTNVNEIKVWIEKRISFIDSDARFLLY